ncbi:MAG: multiheme c-type cytochrome, partial [Myxococcota bacterium]
MAEALLIAAIASAALFFLLRSANASLPRPWLMSLVGAAVVGVGFGASRGMRIHQKSFQNVPLEGVNYRHASACTQCHPDHQRSWYRTYHRTMTQEASPESIIGDFDNAQFSFDDGYGRAFRTDDEFFIELPDDPALVSERGMKPGTYRVDRVVGSHEVQVYMTKRPDGAYLTLPFEWRERDKRWVTTTGNFLQPPKERALFGHTAEWNASCSYCHNTKVSPRRQPPSSEILYDTQVEELGIACEACHGPGAQHIEENRSPLRRYYYRLTGKADPTIVNPERLPATESIQVCGRCHGKWYAKESSKRRILTESDIFIPGQMPLAAHYEDPIALLGRGEDASGYLWPDQTPRPTSMEYQGVALSACFQGGAMTCGSCHSMHDAPPDTQLSMTDLPETAAREDNSMCTQCHGELATSGHGGHDKTIGCVDCHMPFQNFGL